MSNQNTYRPKAWNALCDVCGFKKKSFDLRKRWDGAYCCPTCWETRHPQDFLRARKETSNHLPWSRPEPRNDGGVDVGGNPFPPVYQILVYVDNDWVEATGAGTYFEESIA